MSLFRRLNTSLAAATAMLPGAAMAAEPPCLTQTEFTALATYALPSIITGAAARCAASLPADAFLRTDGAALAARYGDARSAAWPAARGAFLKLTGGGGGGNNLVNGLSDTALQQIVDTAISAKIGDALPPERCGAANQLIQLLSPLPPESTAGVIALAVGLGTKKGGRIGPFPVCPS